MQIIGRNIVRHDMTPGLVTRTCSIISYVFFSTHCDNYFQSICYLSKWSLPNLFFQECRVLSSSASICNLNRAHLRILLSRGHAALLSCKKERSSMWSRDIGLSSSTHYQQEDNYEKLGTILLSTCWARRWTR